MGKFALFNKKPQHLRSSLHLTFHIYFNTFLFQLCYFVFISGLGFGILKFLKPRLLDPSSPFVPRTIDLFFTSVSAATVSSMSTVEMEVFSNAQLIVLTLVMLMGGEVFISMIGLHLKATKLKKKREFPNSRVKSCTSDPWPTNSQGHIEMGLAAIPPPISNDHSNSKLGVLDVNNNDNEFMTYKSTKLLFNLVLGYSIVMHVLGVSSLMLYLTPTSRAQRVLNKKGLNEVTFAIFAIVSSFANCGFIPTNENMIVFSKDSGLLLLLIPQILLGNTLFPSFLRFCIWFFGKCCGKRKEECDHLLKKTREIGYSHLLPSLHSSLLFATAFGFILVQLVLFCSLEWDSEALKALSPYQKFTGALFECVNSRHAGETIVDLSTISAAILVLFVLMMYLPPYTSFLPTRKGDISPQMWEENNKKGVGKFLEGIIFSQLSCLVIFIVSICITERRNMKEDPLNFSALNIVVEVVSAYGNVGFTTGYNCDRRLTKGNGNCQTKWFGFAGKWSDEGKIILMVVMLYGRVKKFNMNWGHAWKLM